MSKIPLQPEAPESYAVKYGRLWALAAHYLRFGGDDNRLALVRDLNQDVPTWNRPIPEEK